MSSHVYKISCTPWWRHWQRGTYLKLIDEWTMSWQLWASSGMIKVYEASGHKRRYSPLDIVSALRDLGSALMMPMWWNFVLSICSCTVQLSSLKYWQMRSVELRLGLRGEGGEGDGGRDVAPDTDHVVTLTMSLLGMNHSGTAPWMICSSQHLGH